MDPISAAIMAIGSLAGGGLSFLGQSQANATNANATGAAIDQRMAAAAKYGISPLTMLGVPSVNAPAQNVFGDAPNAFGGAGRAIAGIKDPHTVEMERIQEALGQSNIIRTMIETSNAKLQGDTSAMILTRMKNDPTLGLDLKPSWLDRIMTMGGAAAEGVDKQLPSMGARMQEWWKNLLRQTPGTSTFTPPGFIPNE